MNKSEFSLIKELDILFCNIRDNSLREFMYFVFSRNPGVLQKFVESPSSRKNHHAYKGGLAFHTISVAKLAIQTAKHYNKIKMLVNEDLIVAGALIHDIGKIHCYEWKKEHSIRSGGNITVIDAGYQHVPRASLYHHIPIGMLDISKLADKFNKTRERKEHQLTQKKIDKLLHIILSHHGRRAWSSPVLPQFVEAYIVHSIEMMDSYVEKYDSGNIPSTIYDGTNY